MLKILRNLGFGGINGDAIVHLKDRQIFALATINIATVMPHLSADRIMDC